MNCGQNTDEKKNVTKVKPEQQFLTFRIVGNEFIEIDIDSLTNFKEILNVIDKSILDLVLLQKYV